MTQHEQNAIKKWLRSLTVQIVAALCVAAVLHLLTTIYWCGGIAARLTAVEHSVDRLSRVLDRGACTARLDAPGAGDRTSAEPPVSAEPTSVPAEPADMPVRTAANPQSLISDPCFPVPPIVWLPPQ